MSSAALPRLALRQSRWVIQRRAASTTTEAASNTASQGASKAKEGASEAAGKAQQGLSRVTSSAGSAVSSTAASAGKALNNVGGRTGQAIQFVQGLIPPTIYYARVAESRASTNPYSTMQTVQSYLTPLQNALRNPSSLMNRTGSAAQGTAQQAVNSPESLLARIRNMDTATLTTVGVVAAETLGFFTVGEMIGRFKLVGYRGDPHGGEHH
ncbi:hypothetical protein BTJ68_14776 [Hortaea werneckii EXF-2000]|uniref:ATP synthase subunit g, mitochondrial n=1 Tax=Hortaea werneckii EXF-2000 TaxID=1157616 RepID=A0A1Z5SPT4_HORWE|nr:hypothetical protein BTJ68_14776 [Hortaea werneckii EXF-2000]